MAGSLNLYFLCLELKSDSDKSDKKKAFHSVIPTHIQELTNQRWFCPYSRASSTVVISKVQAKFSYDEFQAASP